MKHLIMSLIICCALTIGPAMGNDLGTEKSTGIKVSGPSMYFDSRTGHKYVKVDDNAYNEYSKKGKYLKTVPADLPVLVNYNHVYPITETAFMLLDSRTGHKYVKKGEDSYAEFSKKGKYLKTVPADLPLLINSNHIYPVTEGTYIFYTNNSTGKDGMTVLPELHKHPNGYKSLKMLVALD